MSSLEMVQALAAKVISMFVGQNAIIVNLDRFTFIPCQFNPSEYSLIEGADYTEIKRQNSDSPVLNFAGGRQSRLRMTLYFSSYQMPVPTLDLAQAAKLAAEAAQGNQPKSDNEDHGDVSVQVNKLADLRKIVGSAHRPPLVAFIWGSLLFTGFVNSVVSTYTMFDKNGKPLRAKVDVEFLGVPDRAVLKLNPFESPDRTKIRVLSEDESLWSLARKEYGDEGKWRHIAKANNIMDPLDIPPGTVLKVPAI